MSKVSEVFNSVNDSVFDLIAQKEEKAFENTMKRIQIELYKIMERVTVQNFYQGYFPHIYVRTNQFATAEDVISVRLENVSSASLFAFDIIPKYDEKNLDHQTFQIHASYQPRKNKKAVGPRRVYNKVYTYKLKEKPDEEEIMNLALGEGIHRRVGPVNTMAPIWTEDDEGLLWDEFEKYINKELQKIFNEEYDKL